MLGKKIKPGKIKQQIYCKLDETSLLHETE